VPTSNRTEKKGDQKEYRHTDRTDSARWSGYSGFAYAKFGEMLGLKGIFVDSLDRLASAWQEALSSDRPVVLEVKTDPEVVRSCHM
jgi:thiamine pyrophosphate-dependent acetolactate synthase large subunit-like protein